MTDAPTEREGEGIWARLRRRKVVQWGIAYAAGAWGLLQGLAYVTDIFHWPEYIPQSATLALLIGLPIVLVLAWYHGDRGERRVRRTELAIITLLFLAGGGIFWLYDRASETTTSVSSPPTTVAAATDHSIAVLPFVNMSADKEQEYFADGISEELLNLLAQVPGLRVIARTSSFSFKGQNVEIAEIARKLNVANVLEGSVRKSGGTLRITAQLIRAADSSHLWSQTYDRQMTDVFKVQDEIAAAVVDELRIRLTRAAPTVKATDPSAYRLFLQARAVARRFDSESFDKPIALYKEALTIDPTYAPAWDGLAEVYYNRSDWGLVSSDREIPLARAALDQAVAGDANYAPAYARLALVDLVVGDTVSAARHIERGLSIDPANLDVISAASWTARNLGRFDQAIDLAQYVVARDALNEQIHDRLAMIYLSAGLLDEALAEFQTTLALSPGFSSEHQFIGRVLLLQGMAEAALVEIQQEPMESWRLIGLAMAYHSLGRKVESDEALREAIAKFGKATPSDIAYAMAYRGEVDRTLEWLAKAGKESFGGAILANHAVLKNLHSDPRWLSLLREFGVAPEQLAAIKFDVKVPK